MTRQYFDMQIKGLEKLMNEFEEAKKKDNGSNVIAQILAIMIRDRLTDLYYNAVEIDYKNYVEKIKPYLT